MKRAYAVFENEDRKKELYPIILELLKREGISAGGFTISETLHDMIDYLGAPFPTKGVVVGGRSFAAMVVNDFQIITGWGWNFIIEDRK